MNSNQFISAFISLEFDHFVRWVKSHQDSVEHISQVLDLGNSEQVSELLQVCVLFSSRHQTPPCNHVRKSEFLVVEGAICGGWGDLWWVGTVVATQLQQLNFACKLSKAKMTLFRTPTTSSPSRVSFRVKSSPSELVFGFRARTVDEDRTPAESQTMSNRPSKQVLVLKKNVCCGAGCQFRCQWVGRSRERDSKNFLTDRWSFPGR